MTVGGITRQEIEARLSDDINTLVAVLGRLAILNDRIGAELAAGTLDGDDFYGGTTPDPDAKAAVVGAYNEAQALYQWLLGGGSVAAPSGDPFAYAKSCIGF